MSDKPKEAKETPRAYPVYYHVGFADPPMTKEELFEKEYGGADAVLVTSIIGKFGEGAISLVFVGKDGNTGEDLTAEDLFKIWTCMANTLSEELPEGARQELCAMTHQIVKKAVLDARDGKIARDGEN